MITIPSLALGGVLNWFRGSLIAQIAAGVIAFLGVWKINNMVVERKAVKAVVQASKAAGTKRNAKTDQIRARIVPSTAWKRLRQEYADGG